jgi:shikimate kinase
MQPVFLTGFMGSGKTTAAREISLVSGLSCCDMDRELELRYGQSIGSIFSEQGEDFFRKAEHKLLKELCQMPDCIIATGGGTPCYCDNMELINRDGISVYLACSVDELYEWLKHHKTDRPLIRDKSDKELKTYISEELQRREPFYSKAHLIVQAYNTSAAEVWERIREYQIMQKRDKFQKGNQ